MISIKNLINIISIKKVNTMWTIRFGTNGRSRRSRWITLAGVIISALLLFTLSPNENATDPSVPDEVRIGFQTIPNGEVIVKENGWLEQELEQNLGIEVRWLDFAAGADVNAALASGDIDIGLVGSTLFAIGVEREIPYHLIWIFNVIGKNEALVARSDRGIDHPMDLSGKVVATPFGSTTHYSVIKALERAGLSLADVKLIDMKPQEIVAAWSRGDIDAAYTWEPTLSNLLRQGGQVLVTSEDLVKDGIVTADLGAVRSEFLRRYPEIVKIYLSAQAKAVRFINEQPEAAAQIVADAFDLPVEDALLQMQKLIFVEGCEQVTPTWLGRDMVSVVRDTSAFLQDQDILTRVPGLQEIAGHVDTQILEQALDRCEER